MPLDIRSQVVTALDNVNKNPELYTPPKPTTSLETRINDLKEANPSKYKEYISTLTSSANNGNQEAKELLGRIGEDAARQRRGYEGLNKAMYAPSIAAAAVLAAPAAGYAYKGGSWLYSQLPKWVRTGIDAGLTVDGARNLLSGNGVQKTYREAKAGNYGKAALSGIGDILDIGGGVGLLKRGINFTKNRFLNWHMQSPVFPSTPTNIQNPTNPELREQYLENLRKYAETKKDKPPHTFAKKHPVSKEDLSKIKLSGEELNITEDLPVPLNKIKYFESIPYPIAQRAGYNVSNIVQSSPRIAIYTSNKGKLGASGFYLPKPVEGRDLSNYILLNKENFNRSTPTHELHHHYKSNRLLPEELTSEHEKLIAEAYPTRKSAYPLSDTTIERRAVNEQLREEFVNEFYKKNGRYPEINSDRNELFEFLEKIPEDKFEEIIRKPYLRTRYLDDYLDSIKDLHNEELAELSFWKSHNIPKEPSKKWDSKMKYAIGNIPVILGFGLYNSHNDERNNNWNSR